MSLRLTRLDRYGLYLVTAVVVALTGRWAIHRVVHPPDLDGRWSGAAANTQVELVSQESEDEKLSGAAVVLDSSGPRQSQLLRVEGVHAGRDVTIALLNDRSLSYVLILRFEKKNRLAGELHDIMGRSFRVVLDRM